MQDEVIKEILEIYPDVEKSKSLSRVIASAALKYQTKFIILIDEWDAIFREAKDDIKIQKDYVTFLRSLFKTPVTDTMFALAFMTGILPIKKYGTQ